MKMLENIQEKKKKKFKSRPFSDHYLLDVRHYNGPFHQVLVSPSTTLMKTQNKKPHLEFLSYMQAPTNGVWVAGSLNENKDNAVAHWKTGSFFSLQKKAFPN